MKFFVSTLLVFALAYYVQAEMQSTITNAVARKVDGSVLDGIDLSVVENTKINAAFTVKECLTTPLRMSCKLSSGGVPLSSSENTYKNPVVDMQEMGLCSEVDPEGSKDSDCAVDKGAQTINGCDLSNVLKQLPAGEININCEFLLGMQTAFEVGINCVNKEQ